MTRRLVPLLLLTMLTLAPLTTHGKRRARSSTRAARGARAALASVFNHKLRQLLPPGLTATFANIPESFFVRNADEVSVTFHGVPRVGHASVLCTISRAGKVRKRGFLRVQVRRLRQVLIATHPLIAGTVLRASDLRPVMRAADRNAPPLSMFIGKTTTRDIDANVVLSAHDIIAPAVERGTKVRVLVRVNNMTISTWATLERTTRPGEQTKARLHTKRTLIHGRLLDARTLLVAGELL